ncbi:unnamed protein product [Adineta steineri]|uniref:Uncharacterized protein n=1 Tax=Adineta steineri TaxID=433720 RepID=A0A814TZS1_9BILA|nr:unnamed protein product [Adineta steineri]CAF1388552.1 unnamed protein product [Adineta steineri]
MHRYRHFDDVIDSNNIDSPAILPDNENDEAFQVEFNPHHNNYSSNFDKFKYCFSQRTRLERFLIYLVFILLFVLFFITLISLYHTKYYSPNTLCLTSSCIQISDRLSSGMNQSVDPCEDFHEFVCGNWMKKNIIPKGHSSWSTMKELLQKNKIILKNILEQTSITSISNLEQEAIKYYQSCMNISEIERLNTEPLENFFKNDLNFTIKQWIDLDKNQTWQQLFANLINMHPNKHDMSYILPVKVYPDEKNSTWNNIHIDQPHLGLDSRDYYIDLKTDEKSTARNQKIRETYKKVGSDILQLLGFDKNDSIRRMNDIIQFETELAIVSLPMEILQKPDATYYLMPLKQLHEQYQSIGFDIYSYFNNMFNINITNPIKFNENNQIIILSFDLMSNVSKIVTNYLSTPNKSHIVIDHLLLSLVVELIPYLPSIFKQTLLPLKTVLLGRDSLPERWEYCVQETDDSYGYVLGVLYINTVFGETDRKEANNLIKNIREIFDENLDKLQWIDESSKNEAKIKLKKIYEKIGYPDFIRNQTILNERYGGYPMIENDYFNNEIKIITRDRRRTLLKYQQKVDRTDWQMTPPTVNAYYNPTSNEIVFPAGILQSPLFHKDFPISINYGAIGSIIGHEITHGFDNQGRQFDADGNIHSWWSKSSLEKFEEKTKCFVKQYSTFTFDGQNENGQRTLDENIADNGGLKIAYLAYDKIKQRNLKTDNNLQLPGLNYNSDQLFFIASAHSMCNIQTTNGIHYDLTNDPHSPARSRIIGTVQNSDEFRKAFSCKSKTSMNPSIKCQLW